MRKVMLFFILMFTTPTQVLASYYLTPIVFDISFYVFPNEFYSRVGVAAKLTEEGDRILDLSVLINGGKVDIPAEDLEDIPNPILSSLRILYSSDDDKEIYISLEHSEEGKDESGGASSVFFLIREGLYVGRERRLYQ